MCAAGDGEGGLPDQVVFAGGNLAGIAAGRADDEPTGDAKAAFEIDFESDPKSVKARTEVGARAGDTDGTSKGQPLIIQ